MTRKITPPLGVFQAGFLVNGESANAERCVVCLWKYLVLDLSNIATLFVVSPPPCYRETRLGKSYVEIERGKSGVFRAGLD